MVLFEHYNEPGYSYDCRIEYHYGMRGRAPMRGWTVTETAPDGRTRACAFDREGRLTSVTEQTRVPLPGQGEKTRPDTEQKWTYDETGACTGREERTYRDERMDDNGYCLDVLRRFDGDGVLLGWSKAYYFPEEGMGWNYCFDEYDAQGKLIDSSEERDYY